MRNPLRLRYGPVIGLRPSLLRFQSSHSKLDLSIRDLLSSLEMTDYAEKFEAERLTMPDLLKLSHDELRAMVPELGPRTRLVARLTAMRSENPSPHQQVEKKEDRDGSRTAAASSPAAAAGPNTKLKMPEFDDDNESLGTITKWAVQVGDHVKPGKVLCEIETQDAVFEFESPEAGYVTSILVEAGSKPMRAGTVIATLSNVPSVQTPTSRS